MSEPQLVWNNRPVRPIEIDIRTGRVVREAFTVDRENGMWELLVKTLRYVDDGEPVFTSVDEVLAQPLRLQQRLQLIAAVAITVNGLDQPQGEGDSPPV
jgi:hypothetical protein